MICYKICQISGTSSRSSSLTSVPRASSRAMTSGCSASISARSPASSPRMWSSCSPSTNSPVQSWNFSHCAYSASNSFSAAAVSPDAAVSITRCTCASNDVHCRCTVTSPVTQSTASSTRTEKLIFNRLT